MYRYPNIDMPYATYGEVINRGPHLGELHSIKIYEMHIFKDYTESWQNPTVHAFPIEPETVQDLLSPSSLRTLRCLPAEQLAFLAKHLKEMNEAPAPAVDSASTSTNTPAPAPASAQPEESPSPGPARGLDANTNANMNLNKSNFENLEASTMIYTPSGPPPPAAGAKSYPAPPPPPPPMIPNTRFSTPLAPPGMPTRTPFFPTSPFPPKPVDPSAHCLTPWVLESIDFDMHPSTVHRTTSLSNSRRGHYSNSRTYHPSDSLNIDIKTYTPAPPAYQEFTAIYSRWIPSRADDSVKRSSNASDVTYNYRRRTVPPPPAPVQITYSRARSPRPVSPMPVRMPVVRGPACDYYNYNYPANNYNNGYERGRYGGGIAGVRGGRNAGNMNMNMNNNMNTNMVDSLLTLENAQSGEAVARMESELDPHETSSFCDYDDEDEEEEEEELQVIQHSPGAVTVYPRSRWFARRNHGRRDDGPPSERSLSRSRSRSLRGSPPPPPPAAAAPAMAPAMKRNVNVRVGNDNEALSPKKKQQQKQKMQQPTVEDQLADELDSELEIVDSIA